MDRSHLAPEDRHLLARFERGCTPCAHEVLLRLAWIYRRLDGEGRALIALSEGLDRLARDPPGVSNEEALTRYWLTVIAGADDADQMPARSSREFLWRHPELLDPSLPRLAP